jgi:hypothetical protein
MGDVETTAIRSRNGILKTTRRRRENPGKTVQLIKRNPKISVHRARRFKTTVLSADCLFG